MAMNKNSFKNMFDSFDNLKDKFNRAIDRKNVKTVVKVENSNTDERKLSNSASLRLSIDMRKVENILSFQNYDEFTQRLEQCFDEWVKYKCSLEQFQRNDYIRKAYYGEGKIYDLITIIYKKLIFLDNPKRINSAKEVIYHNYIVNLEIYINEMISKNSKLKGQQPYKIDKNRNNVVLFITDECSDIEPVKYLVQAYKIGQNLKDKYVFTDEDFEECRQMNMLMDNFSRGCKDLSGLVKLEEHLKKKTSSNIAVNESNSRLYNKLTEVFTEEWFECVDCTKKESKVNLCNQDNLKEFYEEHLADAIEIITEFKKN